MNNLEKIKAKVRNNEIEFAIPHFFEEMLDDGFVFSDIEYAVRHAKRYRRFTNDPRGTRYEVVGPTPGDRYAAIVCRLRENGKLRLITVYSYE